MKGGWSVQRAGHSYRGTLPMEFLAKLKADALAAWASILAWYTAIQSPVLRVLVIAAVAIIALVLLVKALPYLFVLMFVGGVIFVLYTAISNDSPPKG